MRLASALDLGSYVRDRRRAAGLTQQQLSEAAGVSRRWLSDLETGKARAEIGLVFQVLHTLGLVVEVAPSEAMVSLDEVLERLHGRS